MTDTEDFRLALAEAVALPGEVRPRPNAGHALRARARRRRRVTLVAGATAVPACLILVAVLLGGGGSDAQRATTPAGGGTTSAPAPAAAPSIAPGTRTLSTPIEIRPVEVELPSCAADGPRRVPAADSGHCFVLGPAELTLRQLRDLQTGPRTGPDGNEDGGVSLSMSMTSEDAAAFSALTAESVGRQLALVVDGRVWSAPQVAEPITGGSLQIDLNRAPGDELIALLTG